MKNERRKTPTNFMCLHKKKVNQGDQGARGSREEEITIIIIIMIRIL